jgi:hypothetical protein
MAPTQEGDVTMSTTMSLTESDIHSICQIIGYVTKYREGLKGLLEYAAKNYDEEIEARRKALEAAKKAGIWGISEYLKNRGKNPDSIWAEEYRHPITPRYSGDIEFYIRFKDDVYVFEEAHERWHGGRLVGIYTAEEVEGGQHHA